MATVLWHKGPDLEFTTLIMFEGHAISASVSEGDPRGGTTWIVYLDAREFSSGREPGLANARAQAEAAIERVLISLGRPKA